MNIKPIILTCLGVTFATMQLYILLTGDKCKIQDLIHKSELGLANNHIYIIGIEGVLPMQSYVSRDLLIHLHGTKASSQPISLPSSKTSNYYIVGTPECLGDITHVEVEFDNIRSSRDSTRLFFVYDEKHKKSWRFKFSSNVSQDSRNLIFDTKTEKALLFNWHHNWIALYNRFQTNCVSSQCRLCLIMANMICGISALENLPSDIPISWQIGMSVASSAVLTFILDSFLNVCQMATEPPLQILHSRRNTLSNKFPSNAANTLLPPSVESTRVGNILQNFRTSQVDLTHKGEELVESVSETEISLQKSLRFKENSLPLKYEDRGLIKPFRRLPEENFQLWQSQSTSSNQKSIATTEDRLHMSYRLSDINTRRSYTIESLDIPSFYSTPDLTKYQVIPTTELRSTSRFSFKELAAFPLKAKHFIGKLPEPQLSYSDLEPTVVRSADEMKSPSDNVLVNLDPEEKTALKPIVMYDQGMNILLYSREISVVAMTKEEQLRHFVELFTHLKKAKDHVLAGRQILMGGSQFSGQSELWPVESFTNSFRYRNNKAFRKIIHELERVMVILQVKKPDESVGKLVKQRAKSDVRVIQLKRSRSFRSTSRFSLITFVNTETILPNILLNMSVQLVVIVLDSLKDFHKSSVTSKFHISGSVLFDLKAIVHRFCMEIQIIIEYFDRSMIRCRSQRSEVFLANQGVPLPASSIVLLKGRSKSLNDLDLLTATPQRPVLRRTMSAVWCDRITLFPRCSQSILETQVKEEQMLHSHVPPPSLELLPALENQFLERIIEVVKKMLHREPACASLQDVIRVRMLYHEMNFVEACKDFVSELLDTLAASVHSSTVELYGIKNDRRLKMNIADDIGILLARLFDELATDSCCSKRPDRPLVLPLPIGTIPVLQKYLHDAVIRNYAPKSIPGSINSLRSEEMMLAALLQDFCEDRRVPFPLIHHIHANMQTFLWKILTAQRVLRGLEIKFSKFVIEDIMLRGICDTMREVETIYQIGECKEELLQALNKVEKLYYIEPVSMTPSNKSHVTYSSSVDAEESLVETRSRFTVDQLRNIHSEMCGIVDPVATPWCRPLILTAIGLEIATATVFAVRNGLGDTPTQGLAMATTLAVALILDVVVSQPLKCAVLAHWNARRKRKLCNRQTNLEI